MRPEDVVIVRLGGSIVDGLLKPTSELLLHTLTYVRRRDLGGVVHAHSPAAMAAAAMGLHDPADPPWPDLGVRR